MFFSVYTLGCKLNQLETEAITDSFCREGFTPVPWGSSDLRSMEPVGSLEPSILIINTCTVTSMAEQKARRILRKALRDNPGACLIVTGCYAQMDRAALEEEFLPVSGTASCYPGRLFIIPGDNKDRILDLPGFLKKAGCFDRYALPELITTWLAGLMDQADSSVDAADGRFRFEPKNFAVHSRAFLKIQDGCDRCCSYCRVSLARGKSSSLGAEEVLKRLILLEQRGFCEAVLTGVNISLYHDSKRGLSELLDFLLKRTEKIRLRLSSIEPESGGLGDGFIKVLENKRIRPHFHLSVQSGSAAILSKMGRSYAPEDVMKTTEQIRSIREDPFLACDIITGFPGESAGDFEETADLCGQIGFAWIHAFPFSPRPGTAAYGFSGKVSERDSVKRVETLNEIARKGRREYISRWEGRQVEAVVEASDTDHPGEGRPVVPGVSENYLKLLIDYGNEPIPATGSLLVCRIGEFLANSRYDARSEMVSSFV